MSLRASRSPSPAPPAPAESIIQPGPRATALKDIYVSAIQSTLKFNSYPNFAACFPTPATYCPTALQGVHKQLNTRLEEECVKDFEKILEERKTVQALNEWDAILDSARQRRDRSVDGEQPAGTAAHLLPADQLAAAFMHKHLVTAATELSDKLQFTQQSNQTMMKDIQVQREEIERLMSGIESLVKDVEGAVAVLEQEDTRAIRDTVLETEKQLRATKSGPAQSLHTSMPP